MTKRGRPSSYTEAIANEICERLANGEPLIKICRDKRMPCRNTVFQWIHKGGKFADKYARARERQADFFAEEIIELADRAKESKGACNKVRVQIDARKWAASKMAPKKYGDRLTHVGDADAPVAVNVIDLGGKD